MRPAAMARKARGWRRCPEGRLGRLRGSLLRSSADASASISRLALASAARRKCRRRRFCRSGFLQARPGRKRSRRGRFAMPRISSVVLSLAVAGHLSLAAAAQEQTIRVGWTIPAEESKYWIMRRPEQFPNLGKAYKIEFTQFQGTAPMVQAMVAGALDCSTQAPLSLANGALQANLQAYIVAQHVGERPGSFSVYWAVKDDAPIKSIADMKGKSVGTNVFGSGILGPMFLLLKRNGLDPEKDIRLVETGFPGSEDAIRAGRVDVGVLNQQFAASGEAQGGPL